MQKCTLAISLASRLFHNFVRFLDIACPGCFLLGRRLVECIAQFRFSLFLFLFALIILFSLTGLRRFVLFFCRISKGQTNAATGKEIGNIGAARNAIALGSTTTIAVAHSGRADTLVGQLGHGQIATRNRLDLDGCRSFLEEHK